MSQVHHTTPRAQNSIRVDQHDPTENVLRVIEREVRRMDDLRDAEARRVNDVINIRAEFTKDLDTLRSEMVEKLAQSEVKRIDAVRATDVGAIGQTNERAIIQANTLAGQLTETTNTLRTLIGDTVVAIGKQLEQLDKAIGDRVAFLEKAQYENTGRAGMSNQIMLLISALVGGVVVFIVQKMMIP